MPFAATWIDREIIIVSEGSQRKMNITWYDLRVKSKIRHKKLIYEIETDSQRKQTGGCQGGGSGGRDKLGIWNYQIQTNKQQNPTI